MKFLILAFCVCAASAATVRKPWQQAGAVSGAAASAFVRPAEVAAAVVSAPVVTAARIATGSDVDAPILRSESEVGAEGFNYAYETGNGISAESQGVLKKVEDAEVLNVQGRFAYTAPDGTPVVFQYVADENGYQPQSDLLPVGPPMPPAIARALEYIAAHPQPVEVVPTRRV